MQKVECSVIELKDNILHETYVIGEIVNMSADESVLTDGRVDLSKLQPVIYDSSNNNYRIVGDSVGQAWQSGKAIQDK